MNEHKQKMKFNISDCIVIGDARRLDDKKKPIKTLRRLVYELAKNKKYQDITKETLYQKLYRYEVDGFYLTNLDELADDICIILMVDRDEFVKDYE